jgi:hypothetical protein
VILPAEPPACACWTLETFDYIPGQTSTCSSAAKASNLTASYHRNGLILFREN